MNPQKNWFQRLFDGDRRKAERRPRPALVVYYWTGDAPGPTGIRDISSTGLYLLTDERWYPGTVVRITLQRTNFAGDVDERAIGVQSEVIRCGADGVAFAFILPDSEDSRRDKLQMDVVTSKQSMTKFLQRLSGEMT